MIKKLTNDKKIKGILVTFSSFSIGIVNYKTLDLTKNCLELLKSHFDSGRLSHEMVDVWVVDNNSKDDSSNYLRSIDWIHLIEREELPTTKGFVAHGNGLDAILRCVDTDYMFLMHTDTFIYDPSIFDQVIELMAKDQALAAVGCLDQIDRGSFRRAWRIFRRFIKRYYRTSKMFFKIQSKQPNSYYESNIKSFFACWNLKIIRKYGYTFQMANRNPTYELQDLLKAKGFKIGLIHPSELFKYLDHIQSGTVSIINGLGNQHKRVQNKQAILQKIHGNK